MVLCCNVAFIINAMHFFAYILYNKPLTSCFFLIIFNWFKLSTACFLCKRLWGCVVVLTRVLKDLKPHRGPENAVDLQTCLLQLRWDRTGLSCQLSRKDGEEMR